MGIGLGLGIGLGRRRVSGGISIASLIAKYGSLLTIYDPSNLGATWQDSAGTTPGAVDSPVGRALDVGGGTNPVTQGGGARPALRTGSGLYWWEFDGVDDVLLGTSGGYTGVDAVHYTAAAVKRNSVTTTFILAAIATGTVYAGLRSVATGTTANGSYRNASGNFLATLPNGSLPLNGVRVLDTRANVAYIDSSVNGVATVGSSTTVPSDSLGAATATVGNATMSMNFYGGVMLKAEPTTAERAFIQQYLAGKAGITF